MQKKFALIALSSLLFTHSALAGSPYVSGQLGYFDSDYFSDHGFAARAAAGYLWNTSKRIHLGLETGLTGFQKKNIEEYVPSFSYYQSGYYEHISNQRTTLDVLGVFDFFVTQKFDLFVKLGALYQWNSTHSDDYATPSRDGFGGKLSIGFGYNITPHVNIFVERSGQRDKNNYLNYSNDKTLGTTMLGLRYTFCPRKQVVSVD